MYLLKHNPILCSIPLQSTFTFHYVSIKTVFSISYNLVNSRFTFHYVSIKTNAVSEAAQLQQQFTFHYVSIKTIAADLSKTELANLHSTMYLLKHYLSSVFLHLKHNLHSTMYLLKPNASFIFSQQKSIFTFHYVSIKTIVVIHSYSYKKNLHSTMYLLKRSIYLK